MEVKNTNREIDFYGAKALVYLKYNGSLKELSIKLSEGLQLPYFVVSNNEDYPYNLFGSCECLGFELWLNSTDSVGNFPYKIEIGTQDCVEEIFYGRMYDLSPWLARYISRICSIDTCFYSTSTERSIFIKDGNVVS